MAHEISTELWSWSASDLAAAIREGRVSSVEVTQALLERIDQVNPALNALVDLQPQRALNAAAAADRARTADEDLGPLHGVPISIKDNVDERGLHNSGGVVDERRQPAAEDAPVVRNLLDAGAVSLARSNVPAFSLRWFSENDVYGRTLNPWSPAHTPGGSSGGAATAVATGMVPLAHGNDIGGSVRYPAHVCGVMGLRPTVGRIPSWVPTNAAPGIPPSPLLMSVEGVLARTTDDLALGLRAMSRPDLRDPACVPVPFQRADPLPAGTALGIVRGGEGAPVSGEHHRALDRAEGALRAAGFIVEEVDVPQLAEAHRLWLLLLYEDLRGLLPVIRETGGEAINHSIDHGYAVLSEMWGTPDLSTYLFGHIRRSALIAEMQQLLSRYPVLVMPGSGVETPQHGADLEATSAAALMAGQWPNSAPALLGLPGLTTPTGLDAGLPTGVQLLGGRFAESSLFDVAEALETAFEPLAPIDPVR